MVVLPVPGGPARSTPRFGCSPSSWDTSGILERHDDVRLECLEQIIDPFQVRQLHGLDFGDVDVARHVMLAQRLDEALGLEAIVITKCHTRMPQLTRGELRREPMDLAAIDPRHQCGAQV